MWCARVFTINEAVVQRQDCAKTFEIIRSWRPEDLSDASYVTGESFLRAYTATLRDNGFEERFPRPPCTQVWTTGRRKPTAFLFSAEKL